jgi:galactokinase
MVSDAGIAAVTEAFAERTGERPAGVWAAPGRVNVIGEHTDYNDGFVLPIAIERHVLAAARRRRDDRLRFWSLQEGAPREFRVSELDPTALGGWAAYALGVAWALVSEGVELGGVDLVIDSDLPQGAGLSSSAALECSVGLALLELHDAGLDRTRLALAAQRAERDVVGVPTGVMDQMASLLARRGNALFLDTRSLAWEHVPLPLDAAELELVVIDTRTPRRLVAGAYAERRQACEGAAATLGVPALRDVTLEQLDAAADQVGPVAFRRARHVVTENARVLDAVRALREGRPDRLGALLDASHASLRDDFEVSSPALDTAVEAARAGGAIGARMTGGGFGGSAIALVPAAVIPDVERSVRAAFADGGLGAPDLFAVTAAARARRVA